MAVQATLCRFCLLAFCGAFVGAALGAGVPSEANPTREQLQPLTRYRQQFRKTEDGRLCAAAFVQNRQAYTGCTAVVGLVFVVSQRELLCPRAVLTCLALCVLRMIMCYMSDCALLPRVWWLRRRTQKENPEGNGAT